MIRNITTSFLRLKLKYNQYKTVKNRRQRKLYKISNHKGPKLKTDRQLCNCQEKHPFPTNSIPLDNVMLHFGSVEITCDVLCLVLKNKSKSSRDITEGETNALLKEKYDLQTFDRRPGNYTENVIT